MDLKRYFEETEGTGVLATSDIMGNVDAAIYARPHFMEDGTVALIMKDRLSHANLQSNPRATFLFTEKGNGYRGKRLYMTKVGEEKDTERLFELRQRTYPETDPVEGDPRFLVFFNIEKTLPLMGTGRET